MGGPRSRASQTDDEESVGLQFQRQQLESALFGRRDVVEVGRYRLAARLGEGGMGIVYSAHDPELDRDVAIKVLRKQYTADDHARRRLVREAKAMARLSHPHVVEVFEVGKHRGQVYVAMERVDGEPLSQWLQTPRTIEEIHAVFLDAGAGLTAAHAAGIVHRDFKPHNVLVDRRGFAKVMDFGLAGQLDAGQESVTAPTSGAAVEPGSLTGTGARIGTPHYMSPEQHHGHAIGPASDQFNYCVALHEALHGKLPFAGDTLEELREAVDAERIETSAAKVPAWLDAIVRRGLRRDPQARFASMIVLLAALRRGRRSRLPWLAAPALAIAVVGVGTTHDVDPCDGAASKLADVWSDAHRTEVTTALTRAADENAATQTTTALDTYAREWIATHRDVCEAHATTGRDAAARLDAAMLCLRQHRASMQALVEVFVDADASLAGTAATIAAGLGSPTRCDDDEYLDREVVVIDDPALAEEVERLHEGLARTKALLLTGHEPGAQALLDRMLPRIRELGHAPLLARALLYSGGLADTPDAAMGMLEEAYWIATEASLWSLADQSAISLVWATSAAGQQEDALRWAESAEVALRRQDREPETSLLTAKASILASRGAYDDAVRTYERALDTERAREHPDDVFFVATHTEFGMLLTRLGRYDEALVQLRRADDIMRTAFGPEHIKVAYTEMLVADALRGRGEADAAFAHHQHALDVVVEELGPDHPSVAKYETAIAKSLAALDRHADALEHARIAHRIEAEALGPTHPDVAEAEALVGTQLHTLGRHEDALAHLLRALAAFEAALPPTHPTIRSTQEQIAALRAELDDGHGA